MNDKKVVSLFSGCGGFDLGFEGGFEVREEFLNKKINPGWISRKTRPGWVELTKILLKQCFQMISSRRPWFRGVTILEIHPFIGIPTLLFWEASWIW